MKRQLILYILLAFQTNVLLAQEVDTVVTKPKYSFRYGFEIPDTPFKDTSDEKKTVYPKNGIFTGNIGFQCGRLIYTDDNTGENKTRFRSSIVGTINVLLYKELRFSTTFFYNINTKNQPKLPIWLSDMYYSLKWANWRPHTFSFGYENYADNRYADPLKTWGEKALQGYLFTSYNYKPSTRLINKIRLDSSTNVVLVPMIKYFPTYRIVNNDILKNKIALILSMRYTIWKRLYVEGGGYYYPIQNTRMPWDPDYTYGFGYFDYRPWRLSITYGNWIANRFGSKPEIPKYNFLDGNFSILFNYKF